MLATGIDRNQFALASLAAATPILPRPILIHVAGQRWAPTLPRLAVESYWRAHPLRADRLARALATASGAPPTWRWGSPGRSVAGFRMPPVPYRDVSYNKGPGWCCICGQPVFRFGWHADLWGDVKVNTRARWHACCVAAWRLWTQPTRYRRTISLLQQRRCALTGRRLLRSAEVDHRVPLVTVWREYRSLTWPALLQFWGMPNLQMLNQPAHRAKTVAEAVCRAGEIRLAALSPGQA